MSRKKALSIFLVVFLVFWLTSPVNTSAEFKPVSNSDIFELLQKAFQAQISLSDKFYSYNEIVQALTPYFEEEYIEKFLNENLFQEDEGYIIYGSDFGMFYIPYFSYDSQTNIKHNKEKNLTYVYQFFPGVNEGPVSHNGFYKVIVLKQNSSSWKITDFIISEELPLEIDLSGKTNALDTKDEKRTFSIQSVPNFKTLEFHNLHYSESESINRINSTLNYPIPILTFNDNYNLSYQLLLF